MDVRSLGLRTDLALLAAAGSTIEDRGDHLLARTPEVPSFYWGNFAVLRPEGLALGVEAWDARLAEAYPTSRHRALACDDEVADDLLAPFVEAGYEVERSVVQVRDRDTGPGRVEVDATVRPLVSDADWEGEVDLSRAGEDPEEYTLEFAVGRTAQERRLAESGLGTWWGAFDGDRLVSSLGIFRAGTDLARYQSVKTHPDARRRGLARALVLAAAEEAFGWGVQHAVIVADPDYHAAGLYRSCGFDDRERYTGLLKRPTS